MEKVLHTKWGDALIQSNGYYGIQVGKYRGKLLHRLIFEDFYGWIPKGYIVHHKNGNKLDNCILNLQLFSRSSHMSYHTRGENNCNAKGMTEEHKRNLSKAHMGYEWTEESKNKLSESISGKNHWSYIDDLPSGDVLFDELNNGATYNELAEKYGVKYCTLWSRVARWKKKNGVCYD